MPDKIPKIANTTLTKRFLDLVYGLRKDNIINVKLPVYEKSLNSNAL